MRHGEDDAKERKHRGTVVSSGHGEVPVMAVERSLLVLVIE